MKRLISVILALVLCIGLCACGGTGNEHYDYIIYLLEEEQYDMAIHTIEGLRDGIASPQQPVQQPEQLPDQQADGQISVDPVGNDDRQIMLEPILDGDNLHFHMDVINDTSSTLTLEMLLIIDRLDGQELGTSGFEGADLERLGLGALVLGPGGQGTSWDDGYPASDAQFNEREYLFVFRDENGAQRRFGYIFDLRNAVPGDGGDAQDEIQMSFGMMLENTGDTPWEMVSMDITNRMDGQDVGAYIFEGEDLAGLPFETMVLQPGQQMFWNDGHPLVPDWNGREYRFHFRDARGETHVLSFVFDKLHEKYAPVDYSRDSGRDLQTLRHDANFEVEVFPGVYWVSASALGGSRYENREIYDLLGASPEVKQEKMTTLYEALQLYQVGNFTPSDDNVRIEENGINWEHHKPGYHAVRTNTGCCATDSNWLNYILDGDYDEVGFIATSQRNGSGHVYNYILHNGWYYFIDLTHYHASDNMSAMEDGDMSSYYSSDFILGNIHKTQSVQSYVDYVQNKFNDPPGLMFMYDAENVLAVDSVSIGGKNQITYEEANGLEQTVVFDDPNDNLTYGRAKSPANLPDWNMSPDGVFG